MDAIDNPADAETKQMTVKSFASVEQDERRAELKAVLDSAEFVRAPRLAHLLSYLCEKLFSGDVSQIKEYSIGVEVFRRGDSFDQDSDSIVRVEANRLRKRLAEYYAGDGAKHRLQISIPVGQYVPKFEPRPTQITEEVAAPVAPSAASRPENEKTPGPSPGRWLGRASRLAWFSVAAVLAILVLGYAWHLSRQGKQLASTAEPEQPTAQSIGPQFGPPAGQEIRVLAGANRSFVDHAGKLWSADAWFSGGTAVKSAALHIWRTQEQGFYRTSRQGQFRYDIPLKKGRYELRLHFAETVFGPETSDTGGEGSRIMTVHANGKIILSGFDIVADAGASRTADIKVFPDMEPAVDGSLHLEFAGDSGAPAVLSAIEILPGVRGHMLPVRVLPRQTPYYSNDSRWWSPDEYFEGGRQVSYSAPASGTDDPDLYATDRWGNFSYAIPVSPGRYTLTLFFAARHAEPDQSALPAGEGNAASLRVFNVFCNGKALLQNFDLAKDARQKDVVIRKFENLEPNAQGKLLLNFVPVEGYAAVSGIEVLPQ